VFPYRSQHSSDLYESNGDTIDNAYMNYGIIGWTPEMDTCVTLGGPSNCNQFASPDDEGVVQAVFNKNLNFALNVTKSLPNMGRPKNFENDPSHYQVKATQDIQPNYIDVSYGREQVIEATIRKELGPSYVTATVVGQNGTVTVPMSAAPAGERYGEVPGYYFERRQGTIPATIGTRQLQAGDVVNVIIKAGGLQQEFRYRIESVQKNEFRKRVLVVAAEDYTGVSPNVKPNYLGGPRYLGQHVAALEEAGYEVDVFNIDAPPTNGGSGTPVVRPQIKYPTYFGVMKHFDAVNYYTGDDFIPQESTETNPRRFSSATAQTGSQEMAPWARKVLLELREYANNGGKLVIDGRNVHQTFTATGNSLSSTGPYTWTPDKLFGFFYPPNNTGDDDQPGTAWQRSRGISNDTWQNYLGIVGRQSGTGVTLQNTVGSANPDIAGAPVAAKAGGIFAGMQPFTMNQSAGGEPNQAADGTSMQMARIPLRLRPWPGTNEPLRAERVEADYATPVAYNTTGGAVISTRDTVSFGFGLEQLDGATRDEVIKRTMSYLLPTTADTTPPTIVGFKYPANNSTATPRDPVELELTTYDERGDMDRVDLLANGVQVATTEVYPFQFRYTPPASAIGSTVVLTARAVDAAGNVSYASMGVNVVGGPAVVESPIASGEPMLTGRPVVGQTLTCISGGFTNSPQSVTFEWLRNGRVVAGQTAASYTLTEADLGRTVACRVTGTNTAGSGEATSETLYVSAGPAGATPETSAEVAAPAPKTTAVAPTTPTTTTTTTTKTTAAAPTFSATCKLSKGRTSVSCTVSSTSTATFSASVRLVGVKAAVSKSAKRNLKLTVKSAKKLQKGQKVVVTIKSGKTTKVISAKAR